MLWIFSASFITQRRSGFFSKVALPWQKAHTHNVWGKTQTHAHTHTTSPLRDLLWNLSISSQTLRCVWQTVASQHKQENGTCLCKTFFLSCCLSPFKAILAKWISLGLQKISNILAKKLCTLACPIGPYLQTPFSAVAQETTHQCTATSALLL